MEVEDGVHEQGDLVEVVVVVDTWTLKWGRGESAQEPERVL